MIVDLELTRLARRVPGEALKHILEQLPEPERNVLWDDSDEACDRILAKLAADQMRS